MIKFRIAFSFTEFLFKIRTAGVEANRAKKLNFANYRKNLGPLSLKGTLYLVIIFQDSKK